MTCFHRQRWECVESGCECTNATQARPSSSVLKCEIAMASDLDEVILMLVDWSAMAWATRRSHAGFVELTRTSRELNFTGTLAVPHQGPRGCASRLQTLAYEQDP